MLKNDHSRSGYEPRKQTLDSVHKTMKPIDVGASSRAAAAGVVQVNNSTQLKALICESIIFLFEMARSLVQEKWESDNIFHR